MFSCNIKLLIFSLKLVCNLKGTINAIRDRRVFFNVIKLFNDGLQNVSQKLKILNLDNLIAISDYPFRECSLISCTI